MTRYPAWIDGDLGTYGVSFPDLPGIAMGTTVNEPLLHAEEALRDYVIQEKRTGEASTALSAVQCVETPSGHTLVSIRDSSVEPQPTDEPSGTKVPPRDALV